MATNRVTKRRPTKYSFAIRCTGKSLVPDSSLIESVDQPLRAEDVPDAKSVSLGKSRHGSRLGVLAIFDQCLYSGTNFLTTIVIGRSAGASELGAYTLAFSITVSLISLQRSLLVAPSVVIRGDLSDDHQRDLRSAIAWWAGFLALGVSLIVFGVGIGIQNNTVIALGFCIAAAMVRDFVRRIAFSDYRFTRVIMVDGSVAILQLGGLFVIHRFNPMGYSLTAPVALMWCGWALSNAWVAVGALLISVFTAGACLLWIGPEGAAWGLVAGCTFGFVVRWTLLSVASRTPAIEQGGAA